MPAAAVESGDPQTASDGNPDFSDVLAEHGVDLGSETPDQSVLSQPESHGTAAAPDPPATEPEPVATDAPPDTLLDQLPADLGAELEADSAESADPPEPESDDPEADADEPPAGSPGMVKQIKKLRRQKQEAAERADEQTAEVKRLTAELDSLRATQPAPPEDLGQFAAVKDEAELKERVADMRKIKRWLKSNPDGGDYEGQFVDAERVGKLQDEIELALEEQAPAAKEYLAERERSAAQGRQLQAQYDEHCDATFDWLADEDSVERQTLEQAYQAVPVLRSVPQGKFWAALAVEGAKVLKARQQARAHKARVAPAAPAKASRPAAAPAPAAAPGRISPRNGAQAKAASMVRYEQEPTVQNVEAALAEMLDG